MENHVKAWLIFISSAFQGFTTILSQFYP